MTEGHPRYCMDLRFVPFHCCIVFHCLERLQSIHLGTHSVTIEFFPVSDQPCDFIFPELQACSRAVLTSPTQGTHVPMFPPPSCCVPSHIWIFVNLLWAPSPSFTLCQPHLPATLYTGVEIDLSTWDNETEQDLVPHPPTISSACLLPFFSQTSVKNKFNQRSEKCGNKGKQSKMTK